MERTEGLRHGVRTCFRSRGLEARPRAGEPQSVPLLRAGASFAATSSSFGIGWGRRTTTFFLFPQHLNYIFFLLLPVGLIMGTASSPYTLSP